MNEELANQTSVENTSEIAEVDPNDSRSMAQIMMDEVSGMTMDPEPDDLDDMVRTEADPITEPVPAEVPPVAAPVVPATPPVAAVPEVTPDVVPEIAPDVVPEVAPEILPESNLPEYLKGMALKDDNPEVVVFQDSEGNVKEFPTELVEQAIDWREGNGRAQWINQPLDDMEEIQRDVYKTVQSAHDRHKSQAPAPISPVPSQPGQTEQLYTEDQWKTYYEAQSNPQLKPMFDLLNKINGIPETQVNNQAAPEAKPAAYMDTVESIAESIENGTSAEQVTEQLVKFANEVKLESTSNLESLLEKKVAEQISTQSLNDKRNALLAQIESESLELAKADSRYVKLIQDIGPDNMSPIGRLLKFGNPETGETMMPKQAFKYLLNRGQSERGEGFRFASVQPPQRAVADVEESDLTNEQMTGEMSVADVQKQMLKRMK